MALLRPDARAVREAAWIARCVGRHDSTPLPSGDIEALAAQLQQRSFPRGGLVFPSGMPSAGVWIVRAGLLELSVGTGMRRVVVQILRPGDVDGDLQLLLGLPMAYSAHATQPASCLFLPAEGFEALVSSHPAVSRRWLTSVASRLATSQQRVVDLLGLPLPVQLARLLLTEAVEGIVPLTQTTVAAMLGVRRPSLNRVLKSWERDGLVAPGYSQVRLLDLDRLRRLAR